QAAAMIKSDSHLTNPPFVFLISSYHREEIFSGDNSIELVDTFLSKPVSESRLFDAMVQVFNGKPDHDGAEDSQQASLAGVKVLLVEDNKINQLVATGMLRKAGMVVTLAQNGLEAIQQL